MTDNPGDLAERGRDLWAAVTGAYELAPHEAVALAVACRQADLVARLEAAVDRDGLTVPGSAGQPRLNPAVTELRQCRLALSRLLTDLRLPADEGETTTGDATTGPTSGSTVVSAASLRASRAAKVRWDAERRRREAKGLPASNREVRRRGPS